MKIQQKLTRNLFIIYDKKKITLLAKEIRGNALGISF
jgi:hypothetical protein